MQGLAEYGVAVFSMGCLVFVVLKFLAFIKHHITESTRASQRLADMIEQMLTYLRHKNGD